MSYFRLGFFDIFVIDLVVCCWSMFVSFKGMNSGVCFSFDGLQVVMVLSGGGNFDIYVSNV